MDYVMRRRSTCRRRIRNVVATVTVTVLQLIIVKQQTISVTCRAITHLQSNNSPAEQWRCSTQPGSWCTQPSLTDHTSTTRYTEHIGGNFTETVS